MSRNKMDTIPPLASQLLPSNTHFTEPTASYWQYFLPATSTPCQPPYQFSYPAILPDGKILLLPIRPLPVVKDNITVGRLASSDDKSSDIDEEKKELQPRRALASLLVNQASFVVVEELSNVLAHRISDFLARESCFSTVSDITPSFYDLSTIVVGVPTLGLTVAPLVAKRLGAARYVPLGYSRKFWYEDMLLAKLESVTSLALQMSTNTKRAFLDPNLLLLLRGKSVILVDDVISSGRTLNAVWDFLENERLGCSVLAVGVLMLQGGAWRKLLGDERVAKVIGVLESPILKEVDGGWTSVLPSGTNH